MVMVNLGQEYLACQHCGNDDRTMMTFLGYLSAPAKNPIQKNDRMFLCEVCSRTFKVPAKE
jgi:hypothetical protein